MQETPEQLVTALAQMLAERAHLRNRIREISVKLKRTRAKLDRFPGYTDTIVQPMDSAMPDPLDTMIDSLLGD